MKLWHWKFNLAILGVIAIVAISAGAQSLPKDVYPESRNRLPLIKRDELDDKRKKVYDEAATHKDSFEGLKGEAGIRLHGSTVDVRFESPLGRRLTELAISVAAREGEQNFEWTLHIEEAMRMGLEMPIVDIVRFKRPAVGLGDKETAIINLGREMAQKFSVSPDTFAFALKTLGKSNLVDMAITMSYRANETGLIWADQHLPLDWVEKAPMGIDIVKSPPDIWPKSRSRFRQKEGQRPGTPGRTLSPEGMGPGQISLNSGEGKFLEAIVGKKNLVLAALVVARERNQQVVWTEYELEAKKLGVDSKVVDVVRHRRPTTGLEEREALVIQIGRELMGKHRVSSETYKHAVEVFGERESLDLAERMGEIGATCGLLTIFDQQLPPGQKPLLPIP